MLVKWIEIKSEFERFAGDYLAKQQIPAARLKEAMAYSLLSGGKRIRAILCYLTGEMLQVERSTCELAAFALESIHAYSLIHDDLPAMDDDRLRRGKPTCHIQFGEATAILTGDALQALAFQALSEVEAVNVMQFKKALSLVAGFAGAKGMVSGQQLDIEAENSVLDLESLENIHLLKTGRLITAAVLLPFYLSEQHQLYEVERHLLNFAEKIGLAFQIKDDILDLTASSDTLGKDAQSDLKHQKLTYPSLLGIQEADRLLSGLTLQAKSALDAIQSQDTGSLWKVAEYVIQRAC